MSNHIQLSWVNCAPSPALIVLSLSNSRLSFQLLHSLHAAHLIRPNNCKPVSRQLSSPHCDSLTVTVIIFSILHVIKIFISLDAMIHYVIEIISITTAMTLNWPAGCASGMLVKKSKQVSRCEIMSSIYFNILVIAITINALPRSMWIYNALATFDTGAK